MQKIADSAVFGGFVAMASWPDGSECLEAFGLRSLGSEAAMTIDTVFRIASMSKAVTSVVALQLVAEGKISLETPVSEVLPRFADLPILRGFDADGKAMLREATDSPTVFHLLTHASGLSYPAFSADVDRYNAGKSITSGAYDTIPRLFECGQRWEYGLGIDWLGELIAAVEGETLDLVVSRRIAVPLDMRDTVYTLRPDQLKRQAGMHSRTPEGALVPIDSPFPPTPQFVKGGGGLYSTAADYMKFLRATAAG